MAYRGSGLQRGGGLQKGGGLQRGGGKKYCLHSAWDGAVVRCLINETKLHICHAGILCPEAFVN